MAATLTTGLDSVEEQVVMGVELEDEVGKITGKRNENKTYCVENRTYMRIKMIALPWLN